MATGFRCIQALIGRPLRIIRTSGNGEKIKKLQSVQTNHLSVVRGQRLEGNLENINQQTKKKTKNSIQIFKFFGNFINRGSL